MDTSKWVYIITIPYESSDPDVELVTHDEDFAHAYMLSIADQNPLFYIKELE